MATNTLIFFLFLLKISHRSDLNNSLILFRVNKNYFDRIIVITFEKRRRILIIEKRKREREFFEDRRLSIDEKKGKGGKGRRIPCISHVKRNFTDVHLTPNHLLPDQFKWLFRTG